MNLALKKAALSRLLVRLALAIPMYYHAYWDLSPGGEAYFKEMVTAQNVSANIRFALAPVDFIFATALALGIRPDICGWVFLPLMLGGVYMDASNGYSYRHQGFEVHLCYALLSLSLALTHKAKPATI
jgi:hypothetical protein